MFSLNNNPVLLPYQISILKLFFASDFSKPFFLTGGTGLSAFYYAHRISKDFDFFSLDPFEPEQLKLTIDDIARQIGAVTSVKVASNTYQEIYLEHKTDGWIQRIDIVHEQPRHFGDIMTVDTVRVDSLLNIATNKILALFGRLEPKDYVDFYLIMQKSGFTFDELFSLAKQKDSGLFEFYFASSIAGVEKIVSWPPLLVPIKIDDIVEYYQKLSEDLLKKIKPEE